RSRGIVNVVGVFTFDPQHRVVLEGSLNIRENHDGVQVIKQHLNIGFPLETVVVVASQILQYEAADCGVVDIFFDGGMRFPAGGDIGELNIVQQGAEQVCEFAGARGRGGNVFDDQPGQQLRMAQS